MRLARCLPLLLCLAACAPGDTAATAWRGTIDTLPGGAVLVRNPAEGIWDSASAWRLAEELRIGGEDGDGPAEFGRVRDIAVDDAGRVYVLEDMAQELRVFDSTGAHVRTIGHRGKGPGEFRGAYGIRALAGGGILVVDHANARYSWFDSAGTFQRSAPRTPLLGYGYQWIGDVDARGRLLEPYTERNGGEPPRSLFVRYDPAGGTPDTIVRPRFTRVDGKAESPDGRRSSFYATPFTPLLHEVLDPAGELWFGTSDAYRIVRRRFAGDTVRVIEREAAQLPVTAIDVAEEVEPLDAHLRERYGAAGIVDRSRIPKVRPFFDQIVLDDAGYLWVRADAPRAERHRGYDVFDREGRYFGRARSQIELGGYRPPVIRGDRLWAMVTDSLDVPQIVRLRIVGRSETR